MQEKTPKEVESMINSKPDLKIIDVREQWEFDKCHIENSTHIPMGTIPNSVDQFDDDSEYVIVCHHGVRSKTVALWLENHGIKAPIYNLTGGLEQWSDDVDPSVEKYK
tara:strand:- start:209 stop:532 length:324 start_codon:yes stop_codon:yes gene_type:complete